MEPSQLDQTTNCLKGKAGDAPAFFFLSSKEAEPPVRPMAVREAWPVAPDKGSDPKIRIAFYLPSGPQKARGRAAAPR